MSPSADASGRSAAGGSRRKHEEICFASGGPRKLGGNPARKKALLDAALLLAEAVPSRPAQAVPAAVLLPLLLVQCTQRGPPTHARDVACFPPQRRPLKALGLGPV
eukprot:7307730-Pyramimonas_sp.AAC.1